MFNLSYSIRGIPVTQGSSAQFSSGAGELMLKHIRERKIGDIIQNATGNQEIRFNNEYHDLEGKKSTYLDNCYGPNRKRCDGIFTMKEIMDLAGGYPKAVSLEERKKYNEKLYMAQVCDLDDIRYIDEQAAIISESPFVPPNEPSTSSSAMVPTSSSSSANPSPSSSANPSAALVNPSSSSSANPSSSSAANPSSSSSANPSSSSSANPSAAVSIMTPSALSALVNLSPSSSVNPLSSSLEVQPPTSSPDLLSSLSANPPAIFTNRRKRSFRCISTENVSMSPLPPSKKIKLSNSDEYIDLNVINGKSPSNDENKNRNKNNTGDVIKDDKNDETEEKQDEANIDNKAEKKQDEANIDDKAEEKQDEANIDNKAEEKQDKANIDNEAEEKQDETTILDDPGLEEDAAEFEKYPTDFWHDMDNIDSFLIRSSDRMPIISCDNLDFDGEKVGRAQEPLAKGNKKWDDKIILQTIELLNKHHTLM